MRLWSLHPGYLDAKGLVALWREALLAQAVLRSETRGYRNHPQLDRFKNHPEPLSAISFYLEVIHSEASRRGYAFDRTKIIPSGKVVKLSVTSAQMEYEWQHLLAKLQVRSPAQYQALRAVRQAEAHPIFLVQPGEIEPWERQ